MRDDCKLSAEVYRLINLYFKGDNIKTRLWLRTPNPLLGNVSPIKMIRYGRQKKLLQFIKDSKEESGW